MRDTMSDLIVNNIGALVTSNTCYFLYKEKKKKTLALMHEIFPDERRRIKIKCSPFGNQKEKRYIHER